MFIVSIAHWKYRLFHYALPLIAIGIVISFIFDVLSGDIPLKSLHIPFEVQNHFQAFSRYRLDYIIFGLLSATYMMAHDILRDPVILEAIGRNIQLPQMQLFDNPKALNLALIKDLQKRKSTQGVSAHVLLKDSKKIRFDNRMGKIIDCFIEDIEYIVVRHSQPMLSGSVSAKTFYNKEVIKTAYFLPDHPVISIKFKNGYSQHIPTFNWAQSHSNLKRCVHIKDLVKDVESVCFSRFL